MDSYASRVDGLSAPGDMGRAQNALELVYELRSSAMTEIADKMSTALGNAGSARATAAIARQMQKLLAADVLYATVVRPEINGVLEANGIEGSDVPKSAFLPEGTKWLEESSVSAALGSISGSTAGTSGVHGLGLGAVSVSGTELGEEVATVSTEETPEVEVEVENQGESTENGVSVTVSVARHRTAGQHRNDRRRRNRHRLDPADAGAERRNDARSQGRTGPRRAGHRKQRSQLHRRLRIGRPRCESPTSARPEPSPRTRWAKRRRAPSSSRCGRRRSTTRSSPSRAARPSAPWSPSRTRSRARSAAPSTPSPSRPTR